ncbi:MAG TPA: hypothetical protein VF531_03035 [Bacillota bacterium]
MSDLKAKAAYLRGLIEGADFPKNEKEKLVWEGLMDFCDGIAADFGEMDESQNEFAEYIEAIDEDLSSLEKYFYNTSDSDEEDTDVVFSEDNGKPVMEMACPHCNEEIYFEDEPGNYEVVCPECGKVVWSRFMAENTPPEKTEDLS